MTTPIKKRTAQRTASGANLLQSLDRAIQLLRLAVTSSEGLRLTDLADATGLNKSTAHRLLNALVEHELLKYSAHKRHYTAGIGLYQLGLAAARHFSLLDIARPALERLSRATEDTVFLSVIEGHEALCVDRVVGSYPIKTLTLAPGDRRPLGVGAGSLALLAALADDEAQSITADETDRVERYPHFSRDNLQKLVAQTRRAGFAKNPGKVLEGMSAVAVSIPGSQGRPLGAISIAAISSRMAPKRQREIIELLKREAVTIATLYQNNSGNEP